MLERFHRQPARARTRDIATRAMEQRGKATHHGRRVHSPKALRLKECQQHVCVHRSLHSAGPTVQSVLWQVVLWRRRSTTGGGHPCIGRCGGGCGGGGGGGGRRRCDVGDVELALELHEQSTHVARPQLSIVWHLHAPLLTRRRGVAGMGCIGCWHAHRVGTRVLGVRSACVQQDQGKEVRWSIVVGAHHQNNKNKKKQKQNQEKQNRSHAHNARRTSNNNQRHIVWQTGNDVR